MTGRWGLLLLKKAMQIEQQQYSFAYLAARTREHVVLLMTAV